MVMKITPKVIKALIGLIDKEHRYDILMSIRDVIEEDLMRDRLLIHEDVTWDDFWTKRPSMQFKKLYPEGLVSSATLRLYARDSHRHGFRAGMAIGRYEERKKNEKLLHP